MPRLPLAPESQLPGGGSDLPDTYRALFANPQLAIKLAELDGLVGGSLEPWITMTVALTVANARDCPAVWKTVEPLAQAAGVSSAVIDGISSGKAPRGLLPKDGIWVQFTLEVLRDEVRDSTWQAVTHLVGDAGAVSLAVTACYYEMMVRLNGAFGLESA